MLIERMILALLLTLVLEAIVISLARAWTRRLFWLFIAGNVASNLCMNGILLSHPELRVEWILILEVVVVIVEGLVYRLAPMSVRKAFLLSFLANLFSATVGTLILFLLP